MSMGGIAYIAFKVDDVGETTMIMEREGFPRVQSGMIISNGSYACYNTIEPLKILWEALRVPKTMPISTRYSE